METMTTNTEITETPKPIRIFLSYARGDDEPFVKRLYADLKDAGFTVWFDSESLMSCGLTFHQEIKDAIRTERERVVYVGGPKAAQSAYVREEWKLALEFDHVVVTPILRLGDYDTSVPGELGLLHCEDFRNDANYSAALAKLIASLRQPNPKLGALFAVPSLPPSLIARPDLMCRVRDALLVDLQKPQVITGADAKVGMQGMGGIGKSVLAAALARNRTVRESYPDGIAWIACGQNLTNDDLLARLRDLAGHLGADTSFTSLPQGQGILRECLQSKALLLVLDDVWSAKDGQTFDVLGPRCRMLVTTRDKGILDALHGELVPVSLFTETESLQLLADAVSDKDHPVAPADLPLDAHAVVSECGCLPLALALCGGMAKKRHGDFSHVLQRLRRADLDKIADSARASINPQHASILRAIQASVEMLDKENDEPRRFVELAVFDTDGTVPEAAAATLWEHTGHLDNLDAEDLLINLSERSLIQLDQKTEADGTVRRRFRLHDLLHDYAVGVVGDMQALHRTLLDAYRAKCPDGWHSGPNDGYFLHNLCRHLSHLEAWDDLIGDEATPGPLTDLLFIQAKCEAGLVHDLVKDYNNVLAALPEFREENERLAKRDAAMIAYNKALREYAVVRCDWWFAKERGETRPEPPYPLLPDELRDDAAGAPPEEAHPRAARLRHFANFVNARLGSLASNPQDALPIAYNYAEDSPVYADAERRIAVRKEPWLRRSPRPPAPPLRPQCLRILEGHTDDVIRVRMSPDGRRAVSGSSDKTLRVWDLETGECLRILKGHTGSVGCVCVSSNGRRAVSGSFDGLRVWDLETGECLRAIEGHGAEVRSVCLSPDGRRAVTGSGSITYSKDNTVRVWDLETGTCLRTLSGHTNSVNSVSVSQDGRRAVSCSADTTLRVWDLHTGLCLGRLNGHTGSVGCVCVSPDGKRAVSGSQDQTLRVWDLETGRCLCILQGHSHWVTDVSISPDGRRVVSGSMDKILRVWDLATGKCLCAFEGHSYYINSVDVSSNGRRAVSGSSDKTLRVWDLETGTCLPTLEGHSDRVTSVSAAPHGRRAVSGSWDNTLRLWDLDSGRCTGVLRGHTNWVNAVSMCLDGERVVSADEDNILRLWDIESRRCLHTLVGHTGYVRSVCACPDGKRAVSAGWDRTLRIWDLDSGRCLETIQSDTNHVNTVSVSPDGRLAVSGSDNAKLAVWNLVKAQCIRMLQGHSIWVAGVGVSPDGRRAVSASLDKTLRVWDLESGQCVQTLQGHSSAVKTVSVSPDGRYVVSGSDDKTVRAWNIETGICRAVYNSGAPVGSVCFSPCGNRIICGTADGQMHFLTPVNFPPSGPPILSAVRLWHFGENGAPSRWDEHLTAVCPHCGWRFPVRDDMIGQQIACPLDSCGKPLQMNPFVVDSGKDRNED